MHLFVARAHRHAIEKKELLPSGVSEKQKFIVEFYATTVKASQQYNFFIFSAVSGFMSVFELLVNSFLRRTRPNKRQFIYFYEIPERQFF